jgi:hypothetical protein
MKINIKHEILFNSTKYDEFSIPYCSKRTKLIGSSDGSGDGNGDEPSLIAEWYLQKC